MTERVARKRPLPLRLGDGGRKANASFDEQALAIGKKRDGSRYAAGPNATRSPEDDGLVVPHEAGSPQRRPGARERALSGTGPTADQHDPTVEIDRGRVDRVDTLTPQDLNDQERTDLAGSVDGAWPEGEPRRSQVPVNARQSAVRERLDRTVRSNAVRDLHIRKHAEHLRWRCALLQPWDRAVAGMKLPTGGPVGCSGKARQDRE
jgi:hypothetical protein